MDVNLQVIGIFYNSTLSVTTPNPTVKDLLDAAIASPSRAGDKNPATKFGYTTNGLPGNSKTFASSFLAAYDQDVIGRVLEGATYPPGEYFLDEHLSARPAYTVWQYYMFDAVGRYLNKTGSATPFAEQPLKDVSYSDGSGAADVARVTWRLVSVLGQPTTPAMANSNKLIVAGSPPSMRQS